MSLKRSLKWRSTVSKFAVKLCTVHITWYYKLERTKISACENNIGIVGTTSEWYWFRNEGEAVFVLEFVDCSIHVEHRTTLLHIYEFHYYTHTTVYQYLMANLLKLKRCQTKKKMNLLGEIANYSRCSVISYRCSIWFMGVTPSLVLKCKFSNSSIKQTAWFFLLFFVGAAIWYDFSYFFYWKSW